MVEGSGENRGSDRREIDVNENTHTRKHHPGILQSPGRGKKVRTKGRNEMRKEKVAKPNLEGIVSQKWGEKKNEEWGKRRTESEKRPSALKGCRTLGGFLLVVS